MDDKEGQLIARWSTRLELAVLDEMDGHVCLALLRRHAATESLPREFGDFLAHRERDRGEFNSFLDKQHKQVSQFHPGDSTRALRALGQAKWAPKAAPRFSEAPILEDVNEALAHVLRALKAFQHAGPLVACLILLLRSVRFHGPATAPFSSLKAGRGLGAVHNLRCEARSARPSAVLTTCWRNTWPGQARWPHSMKLPLLG